MLTPETIASRRFDKQVGGYKQDEVEMFYSRWQASMQSCCLKRKT